MAPNEEPPPFAVTADETVGVRSTALFVTVHEGCFDADREPLVDLKFVEHAVWQWEWGEKRGDDAPKHIHLAVSFKSRQNVKRAMAELFPATGCEKKHVMVPKQGVRFSTLALYSSKESHRVTGTTPTCFDYDLSDASGQKRKLSEMTPAIHAAGSHTDLATGDVRPLFAKQTTAVAAIHAERPMCGVVLRGEGGLLPWEKSILCLLERPPGEKVVHWFVAQEAGDPSSEMDRISRFVMKAMSQRRQSRQAAFYASNHPQEALDNHLTSDTRVIFVRNVEGTPISHARLAWLKSGTLSHRSSGARYGFNELSPRHVVVFSISTPELRGPGHKWARVFKVPSRKEGWARHDELMATVGALNTSKPFIRYKTLGSSGILAEETDCEQVGDGGLTHAEDVQLDAYRPAEKKGEPEEEEEEDANGHSDSDSSPFFKRAGSGTAAAGGANTNPGKPLPTSEKKKRALCF